MNKFILITLLSLLSTCSFAFSATGHKVVCELAYQQLDDSVKQTVDTLVAAKNWDDFAEACTWPDWSESEPKARKKLGTHYINVPRSQTFINSDECTQASECLFTAIYEDLVLLKEAETQVEQAKSLAYIGHFVADLHQPLHVSFADDLGGNRIEITNDVDCRQNLHAVWDDCVVRRALQNAGVGATNYQDYVQLLLDGNQLAGVSGGVSNVSQWANESLQISRNMNIKYCLDSQCRSAPSSVNISDSYLNSQANVAEQQMLLASKRLAKLLNSHLAGSSSISGFSLANEEQAGSFTLYIYSLMLLLLFRRFCFRK